MASRSTTSPPGPTGWSPGSSACQGDIAVFSHGHFLRVLAARWLGLAPTAGGMLLLDTGTISVLSTERESPAIRLWNGVPPAAART